MIESTQIRMTEEEYNEKQQMLTSLKIKLQNAIEDKNIAHARGDLSENAEFDGAKKSIEDIKNEIDKLTELLTSAEIISGYRRYVLQEKDAPVFVCKLVASDPGAPDRVSLTSKLGKRLVDAKVGDVICYIDNAYRQREFKVLAIKGEVNDS